ncbi:MAG: hypothetical protein NT084_10400 [Bacteroidetes bacterium]|nr:hypothetical protein [Bacteroidota bacterium]
MIKFNALYQSLKKVSAEWHAGHVQWQYSWYYLKCFEGGTFVYALFSSEDFEHINIDLSENSSDHSFLRGHYEINSSSLINLKFENGIEIGGEILDGNKLILNGKLSWELFSLV